MITILNGKKLSEEILEQAKTKVKLMLKKPKLAVVSTGNDPASQVYIRNKRRACEKVGIEFEELHLDLEGLSEQTSIQILCSAISELNNDASITGILVQKPIYGIYPEHEDVIINMIDPNKDVDVFNKENLANLMEGNNNLLPCTPKGVLSLLDKYNIKVEGKHIVIIGRSNIVGKPLALALLNKNATVTICHSKTVGLQDICKTADILVSAVGKPKFITRDFIGFDTNVIIDVGINRDENNKLCGDVDFEDVSELFEDMSTNNYITPVPGGVGAMTVASLIENTIDLTHKQFLKEIS